MPYFIKDSLIYRIFDTFHIAFNNSLTKEFFLFLINIFKNSIPYKLFIKYINKDAYFTNSLAYKGFSKFINLIGKLADIFNKVLVRITKSSKFYQLFSNINMYSENKKNKLFLICFFSTFGGYILGVILTQKFSIFVFTAILLFSLIILNLNYIKNSLIYRFFKYLFS